MEFVLETRQIKVRLKIAGIVLSPVIMALIKATLESTL